MFDYRLVTLVSVVLLWLARQLISLRGNVAIVKDVGVPYGIARKLMNYVSILEHSCSYYISCERHCWLFLDGNPRSHPRPPEGLAYLSRLALGNVCI